MLGPDQLELQKRALEELRTELTQLISSSAEASKPVDLDEPIGRLSRVDAMRQQRMIASNRQAAQQRRRQTESALARIDAEEYGECLSCGEDIDDKRLVANPEAQLCLECQGNRESRGTR